MRYTTKVQAGARHEATRAAAVLVVVLALLVGVILVWAWWPQREVVLVGDSILRQTTLDLRQALPGSDVPDTAVNGSGLITPGVYDWQARVPELLAGDPEAAVVLFVGNHTDVDLPTDPEGRPIEKGSPQFFVAWGAAYEQLAEQLLAAEVDVRWVLPPPMLAPENQAIVDGLRAEMLAVAERHRELVVVDAYDALAAEDGSYLPDAEVDGVVVPLRAADGVHLAPAGAERLADLIATSL